MNETITALMPVGKYREQAISDLPTTFLAWFISQDNIRFKYPKTTRSVLAELRGRFLVEGAVESELLAAGQGGTNY